MPVSGRFHSRHFGDMQHELKEFRLLRQQFQEVVFRVSFMSTRIGSVLILIVLGKATLRGDVIYLKNGDVIVAEKAWEEKDQVKYQVSSGIQTIPRATVKRLQGQKANPADPSHKQPLGVEVIRKMGAPAVISREQKTAPGSVTISIR